MDEIRIKNLEVFAKHGVFPEENVLGQKFVVSAVLYTDTREAGKTDDLTRSIHYGEVSHFIRRFLEEHTWKLLETIAERLAEALLLETKGLEKVWLEIQKPWAPIGLPLETVSVAIRRQWHTAYVALGSNMGDRQAFLQQGVDGLKETRGCEILAVSDFIDTAPYGVTDQAEFLNGAVKLRTLLTPWELLERLHEIEQAAGRERVIRWGPRTLDLDILLYDDLILDEEELHIPHIEMHKRDFVLKPLCMIAPYARHPLYGRMVRELLEELES
ncbi:MAG: 2-amino-4-hydroxy-6-hydroxymethyldihydropteridine diphosphokinase [Lachnospiraceae bacterium]|jgi:dihydroneopterin aldolase/2-amino-4-hydroxy-6-hydroxymethyldihydropteridine diphosphokinase|nr:2-amino-4-hydroxy-6-hydroxymethyldihydropteridine diphosphokinase [Lachnospiraceae bacterium]MCI8997012.1 2-amino-4-hydroxy-6-hydroxymethyldihydropteridine diphosphokinase [Lachnospiraceae bacterium]MCI9134213.1 2-amino-4-hydroxy-6-hydroxymethyldihydropteridine diphosphokinase [Lachnospiraceae bacterium]